MTQTKRKPRRKVEVEKPSEIQPEVVTVPPTPAVVSKVPLSSLSIGRSFILNGELYRVAEINQECVVVTKLKETNYDANATMNLVIGQASLDPNTLVELK